MTTEMTKEEAAKRLLIVAGDKTIPEHRRELFEQAAALLQSKQSDAQPKLILALPDWETRRIVIVSDEVIDGERLVCVAIQDAQAEQKADELPPLPDEDDCIVHIYPSDLERMAENETFANVFSVAAACPDERSTPLYTADQMREYAHLALSQSKGE